MAWKIPLLLCGGKHLDEAHGKRQRILNQKEKEKKVEEKHQETVSSKETKELNVINHLTTQHDPFDPSSNFVFSDVPASFGYNSNSKAMMLTVSEGQHMVRKLELAGVDTCCNIFVFNKEEYFYYQNQPDNSHW